MSRSALLPALALSLAAAAAACGGARDAGPGPGPGPGSGAALLVVPLGAPSPAGGAAVARAEIASTPEARERGLMRRDVLPEDTGMLFVYPEERALSFWMKDCRSPLAAAFLDGEGRILNIEEMAPGAGVPDGDLPRYPAKGPARYVLEMEGGWFARKGIRAGDRADLGPALRGVEPR